MFHMVIYFAIHSFERFSMYNVYVFVRSSSSPSWRARGMQASWGDMHALVASAISIS